MFEEKMFDKVLVVALRFEDDKLVDNRDATVDDVTDKLDAVTFVSVALAKVDCVERRFNVLNSPVFKIVPDVTKDAFILFEVKLFEKIFEIVLLVTCNILVDTLVARTFRQVEFVELRLGINPFVSRVVPMTSKLYPGDVVLIPTLPPVV